MSLIIYCYLAAPLLLIHMYGLEMVDELGNYQNSALISSVNRPDCCKRASSCRYGPCRQMLVASESSMLLPTALAQKFKESLLQNSKGNSALINGPSPSWHSLPILFQTNSFVGIKSRTKTRSCWTRPGNCPTSHPKNLARTSIIVFRRT